MITTQITAVANDPAICKRLLDRLETLLAGRQLRFMEVCGTHTVALFQSGLRQLLPKNITHLSGPGCPVCVTHESEVAQIMELSKNPDVIIATFGDLLRIPDPNGQSLKHAAAEGACIRIVYSPLAAVDLAAENRSKTVVFIGAGFETTAPAAAAAIILAQQRKLTNFCILSLHKLIGPALKCLLMDKDADIDAFLLPGHVATITGLAPFEFISRDYHKPASVSGFEPADILLALCDLATQSMSGHPKVSNLYPRAVSSEGNQRACDLMNQVFEPIDTLWRGLGKLPASGLAIRNAYAAWDANKRFNLHLIEFQPTSGCRCGDILRGLITPPECKLFGNRCQPATPIGPCMVSTEGSCAAWYKYGDMG